MESRKTKTIQQDRIERLHIVRVEIIPVMVCENLVRSMAPRQKIVVKIKGNHTKY